MTLLVARRCGLGRGASRFGVVGSPAASSSLGASITPSWGTGMRRKAGNLLVLLAAADGLTGVSDSSWVRQTYFNNNGAGVWLKTALGGDAAPTLNIATPSSIAVLFEVAKSSMVVDQMVPTFGSGSGRSLTLANPAPDAQPGELFFWGGTFYLASPVTVTGVLQVPGNVAIAGAWDNPATDTHFSFVGYGITTSNSVADNVTGSIAVGTVNSSTGTAVSIGPKV